MDVLVRLIGRLARLVYKSYVFSTLRLHDSVNLAWPGIKSTFWYEIDVHDIMTFKTLFAKWEVSFTYLYKC